MTERIDPINAWAPASTAVLAMSTEKPRAETARMRNTELGKCPVCNVDMPVVLAADNIPVYVCEAHCVCVPTKD